MTIHLLEYYYNQPLHLNHYVTRKKAIPTHSKINIFGVRGSGKTSLVQDYLTLQDKKTFLYIDFENPNLLFNHINHKSLNLFIQTNNIKILILDHYEKEYFNPLPKVEKLIIVSRIKLNAHPFQTVELYPLDYEEFLAFDNSSLTRHKGFEHFLRLGTLPFIAIAQKLPLHPMKLFFQTSFNLQEQKLLSLLANYHTHYLTINQIYHFAKKEFKVSKDWLYKTIKEFEEEKLLFFIENYEKKSGKKMILFDFAFAKYLTIGQTFIIQFEAMVALALIKHNIPITMLSTDGYFTKEKELIIPAPFESEESIWLKSQKKFSHYKEFDVKKVTIITASTHYHYHIEKIYFEALPFNEWSVINNEKDILF